MRMLQALIGSDDVRSLTLLAGTCLVGFAVACPSIGQVRVVFVVAATVGVAAWLLAQHDAVANGVRMDDAKATSLFEPKSKTGAPYAMMLHPEATSAIAQLSVLSRPGRRTAVKSVADATEGVIRAYHSILNNPRPEKGRGTAGTDGLRDATIVALDALQALRMETGSRGSASHVAASTEARLRRLFVRFRQIAGNKLKAPGLYGSPFPYDPRDDQHSLR